MNPDENQTNNGAQNQGGSEHKDPVLDFTKGNNSTVMAVLAYIGPLVIVPFLMEKKDEFVKFHTKQGLVLFGLEIVIMILGRMMFLWMLGGLLNLAAIILSIIGIINVVQGQKKELPVVGSLAHNIKI
jgi:uncharacterized membrane protein